MVPNVYVETKISGPLSAAVLLLIGVTFVNGADPSSAETVSLTFSVDSQSIYTDDPILLKCALRNDGKTPVTFLGAFESRTSGVRIEVRSPDAKDFRSVHALGEGQTFGVPKRWELKEGKMITCYSQLFGAGCFRTAGKWEVRIKSTVDDKEVVSQPVTISVAERPEKASMLFKEYESEIHSCVLWRGYVEADELGNALEVREVFRGSMVGRAITEAQLHRALLTSSAARARALALDDIKRHRDELGSVAKEYFDLSTAQILIGVKEYAKAKALLDGVADPSVLRNRMRAQILLEEQKMSTARPPIAPQPRPVKP